MQERCMEYFDSFCQDNPEYGLVARLKAVNNNSVMCNVTLYMYTTLQLLHRQLATAKGKGEYQLGPMDLHAPEGKQEIKSNVTHYTDDKGMPMMCTTYYLLTAYPCTIKGQQH